MSRVEHFVVGSQEHFQATMGTKATSRSSATQDKSGEPLYLKSDIHPEPQGDGFLYSTHAYRLQGGTYKHIGLLAQSPTEEGKMYTSNIKVHGPEQKKGIGTAMLMHSVDHPRFLETSHELSAAGASLQNSMRRAHS